MTEDTKKTIRLSQHDRVIAGVCGGIGHFLKLDSSIVRIIFILSCFILVGLPVLLYFILWIILPKESLQEALSEEEKDQLQKEGRKQKKKANVWVSLIFALMLIMIGISLAIPDSKFLLKDAGILLFSAAFLLLAIKIGTVMVEDKKYSPVSLAVIIILGTLSVFIPLISYEILKFGVLLEYAKFTLPAILILGGIIIILNSTKSDWARTIGMILTVAIFASLGVLSVIKGNYSISEKFANHKKEWMNWVSLAGTQNHGNFQMQLRDDPATRYYDYLIKNNAGSMKIRAQEAGIDIEGRGITPQIETNLNTGIMSLTLENKAADTRITLPQFKPGDMKILIGAGEIDADLAGLEIRKLGLMVNLGSADIKVGPRTRTIDVQLNAGEVTLELPVDSTIRLEVKNHRAMVDIPRGFIFTDNAYIYKGKGGPEILVTAQINAGSIRIELD